MKFNSSTKLTLGVELELYSIVLPEYRICREIYFPKKGTVESGEKFKKDTSIGIEYNSKIFNSVREAHFLLKNGLRKYMQKYSLPGKAEKYIAGIMPIGGWRDRFAATHFHIGLSKGISKKEALSLSKHIHDHLPFLIAICANSPIWSEKFTNYASYRLKRGTKEYCKIVPRGTLSKKKFTEMRFNPKRILKSDTLEIRVCDSNIPEYVCAVLAILQVISAGWLNRRKSTNISTHDKYLLSRDRAIKHGIRAKLSWNNRLVSVSSYIDLIFKKYKKELKKIELPEDILEIIKLLKIGWNGSRIIREAVKLSWKYHPQTWQKRFAKRYVNAIKLLLDGGNIRNFAKELGVRLPSVKEIELG